MGPSPKFHEARDILDRELADAFASIVANLFTNYFNHYVGIELDLPAAPALDPSS